MIDMLKERAIAVAKVLDDIEDFELFMDQISQVYRNNEGNLSSFYYDKLVPLMKEELRRREAILEEM